jgi:hypothetical protein
MFQSFVAPRANPSSSQDGNTFCGHRLMFSIVWGCLSTIFLCAWVSIHPNIPKPQRLEGIYRRFQLLFWMVVAPELILVLAMRQWVAAGRIADIYNDTKLKEESKRKRLSAVKTLLFFIAQKTSDFRFFFSQTQDGQEHMVISLSWVA